MCLLIICTIHHHVSETGDAFSELGIVHCLGLSGLWLCNVSYLPILQLGALNVPRWMKRARSVSSW